ncbi:biotin/lipoyl-binding protein, partial [Gibbsiella quercinecans]|uniref:biotin/lipoyl-binding protein n=1 Tax=Gibbsiella quercinecans TaxID=929813 RepID=UPI000EF22F64
MSESVEKQAPQPVKRNKKKQRKRVLTLLTLIFIVLGCAWFVYWFLVLRHHQNTDDSYIAVNQIQVMAQVTGSVSRVNVDNTDYVKQGDVLVELDPTDAQRAGERPQLALTT